MNSSLEELKLKVQNKSAIIGVIGLGYVGLPVAVLIAQNGFKVFGIDRSEEKVSKISQGVSPIEGDEPGLQELLMGVHESTLYVSNDYNNLKQADIILIAVDTPVDSESLVPKYEALKGALSELGKVLKKGALVIIESTIAPGTVKSIVIPTLTEVSNGELNIDFYIGHCPERVMPGKLIHNLVNYARVVGGSTSEVANVMKAFYSTYVKGELDMTDIATAEIVKTTENYYRDVQIAFANQLALNCELHQVDVYKARELINKVEHRDVHIPGAGVGGHCIPKDGLLNVAEMRKEKGNNSLPVKMADLAREINNFMPSHVGDLLLSAFEEVKVDPVESTVTVLGYAFLPNSDDTRNSPSEVLIDFLKKKVKQVIIHDPYVKPYDVDLAEACKNTNAIIVMVSHSLYLNTPLGFFHDLLKTRILIDGRNVYSKQEAIEKGFIYKGVGNI